MDFCIVLHVIFAYFNDSNFFVIIVSARKAVFINIYQKIRSQMRLPIILHRLNSRFQSNKIILSIISNYLVLTTHLLIEHLIGAMVIGALTTFEAVIQLKTLIWDININSKAMGDKSRCRFDKTKYKDCPSGDGIRIKLILYSSDSESQFSCKHNISSDNAAGGKGMVALDDFNCIQNGHDNDNNNNTVAELDGDANDNNRCALRCNYGAPHGGRNSNTNSKDYSGDQHVNGSANLTSISKEQVRSYSDVIKSNGFGGNPSTQTQTSAVSALGDGTRALVDHAVESRPTKNSIIVHNGEVGQKNLLLTSNIQSTNTDNTSNESRNIGTFNSGNMSNIGSNVIEIATTTQITQKQNNDTNNTRVIECISLLKRSGSC